MNQFRNRSPIFKRSKSLNRHSSKFEHFVADFLPDWLNKFSDCECLNSTSTCPYTFTILNRQNMRLSQEKYNQLKINAVMDTETKSRYNKFISCRMTERDKILQPHLNNLLSLIKPKHIEPLFQILRHTKSESATFWIFAKLCEKWPNKLDFERKIKEMLQKQSKPMKITNHEIQYEISKMYDLKLTNIAENNYMKAVKLMIKQQNFALKLAVTYLLSNSLKSGAEIINATIDHDLQN